MYTIRKCIVHVHYTYMYCTCGVLWPSGLVHWTQVLVLPECGFESRPGRSRRLFPWAKTLNHNCFVLRMGRKAVGPVCCVMHVKEPRTLIVKEKGLAPVFLDSRLDILSILSLLLLLLLCTCIRTDSRRHFLFCRHKNIIGCRGQIEHKNYIK